MKKKINQLPTAKDFLNQEQYYSVSNDYDTQQAMIEFAKFHVKKALNENHIRTRGCMFDSNEKRLRAVKESYPLTNIK